MDRVGRYPVAALHSDMHHHPDMALTVEARRGPQLTAWLAVLHAVHLQARGKGFAFEPELNGAPVGDRDIAVIAWDDERPVGYLLATDNGSTAGVWDVGVLPERRSEGIGSAMFRALAQLLDPDAEVGLAPAPNSDHEAEALLRFYRRCGMNPDPDDEFHPDGPRAPLNRMTANAAQILRALEP